MREGLYFTDADLEQAGLALETAVREGRESVTFKCADREAYEELYQELLTEQKIFQYLQGGRGFLCGLRGAACADLFSGLCSAAVGPQADRRGEAVYSGVTFHGVKKSCV